MGLSTLLASDMAKLINTDDFGESATYTDPNGQTTALTVVLFGEQTETPEQEGIKTKLRTVQCTWSVATLSDVNLKATISVNGQDWSVAQLEYQDDQQVSVRLERHELMEHTRPGYRRGS